MIFLTTAVNDRSLARLFGIRAKLLPIDAGDFFFKGLWTGQKAIKVCGERKKVGDLVQCINDGRHIRQVQYAREEGMDIVFLVVEGLMKEGPDGDLDVWRRGWVPHFPAIKYRRVQSYIDQLEFYGGLVVRRTRNAEETVRTVCELHDMFQVAPEDHSTLHTIYTPPSPEVGLMGRPSLKRRILKEVEGVGWQRALDIKQITQACSIAELATWSTQQWKEVPGIGDVIAKSLVEQLQEVNHG